MWHENSIESQSETITGFPQLGSSRTKILQLLARRFKSCPVGSPVSHQLPGLLGLSFYQECRGSRQVWYKELLGGPSMDSGW